MNTQKTVNNKISKIALKNQKVDLSLIDDLKAKQKESTKDYIGYVDDMDASKGFLSRAIKQARKAVQTLKESADLFDKAEIMAKDLGIDLPSEVKKQTPREALSEAEKDLNMMESIFKQFKVR